jgi:MFS family permease
MILFEHKIRWDNITKAFLAMFFSQLYFYLPILTLYYQGRGLSLAQIGSLTAIIIGVKFLAEIPTGVVADRYSRKLSISIALGLQLLGEIIFFFAYGYPAFVFITVIAGLGFSFLSGAFDALIYDSLKGEGREGEMKKVMGNIGAALALSTIMGAGISSFVLSRLTPDRFSLAILMTICTVAVGFIFSLFLHEPKRFSEKSVSPDYKSIVKDSFNLIKNNKLLLRIILLTTVATPFQHYLGNLYQPYFVLSKVPGTWFGLALSAGGILALLGVKYSYLIEKKVGASLGVLLATILPAVFYLLMAFIYNPTLAVILFCLGYGSMSLKGPLFSAYQNAHIPSENRATTLSAINMFSGAYVALMGPIIGYIADISISYSFLLMGCIILIGSLLFRINEEHLRSDRL